MGYSALSLGFPAHAYLNFLRVSEDRPWEPQNYIGLAESAAAMGKPDLALFFYEVVLAGQWQPRFQELSKIATFQYVMHLRSILAERDSTSSSIIEYVQSRYSSAFRSLGIDKADLIVLMSWNTDNSDVDLHVTDPGGEKCFYGNRRTRIGGELSHDVVSGFGPEMFVLNNAVPGKYTIAAQYYSEVRNRAGIPSKVSAQIIQDWSREIDDTKQRGPSAFRKIVVLQTQGRTQHIATVERKVDPPRRDDNRHEGEASENVQGSQEQSGVNETPSFSAREILVSHIISPSSADSSGVGGAQKKSRSQSTEGLRSSTEVESDGEILPPPTATASIVSSVCESVSGDSFIDDAAMMLDIEESYDSDMYSRKVVLVDVIPLSLGVETCGGVMSTMVERNNQIPLRKSKLFSTSQDNQTTVVIRLFQGERAFVKDNQFLGELRLSGIDPAPRGTARIVVHVEVDEDSKVHISAVEERYSDGMVERSSLVHLDVEMDERLSDEGIERIVAEAWQMAEVDAPMLQAEIARNHLLEMAVKLRRKYLKKDCGTCGDEKGNEEHSVNSLTIETAIVKAFSLADDFMQTTEAYTEGSKQLREVVEPLMLHRCQKDVQEGETDSSLLFLCN